MDDAKSKTWYAIALGGAGTYHTVEVPAPLGERENIKPKAIVPSKQIDVDIYSWLIDVSN